MDQKKHEKSTKTASFEQHQPIIGIPLPVQQGNQGPVLLADAVGAWALEQMGARVLLIPLWPLPTHDHRYHSLWSLIQSIDGVLLPAGLPEIPWSARWKEREQQPGPQIWPLSWEIALAQLASYIGMPVLAIADGAEKWNMALGGRSTEPEEDPPSAIPTTQKNWEHHTIRVRAQSTLATLLQPAIAAIEKEQTPWELAFMPHQGVEHLAPGLRSCAQFAEKTIVAFERRDEAFGLGIVGRLDWGHDQMYGRALFDAFLQACRSFDHTRQHKKDGETSYEAICATVAQRVAQHQPLITVSSAPPEGKRRHPSHLSGSLSPISHESRSQQERNRQRSSQPTKEELNRIRRQRLKITAR